MKILKKISKVIVIVMAVLATIWCGLYVYANYFYNDKQIDVEKLLHRGTTVNPLAV